MRYPNAASVRLTLKVETEDADKLEEITDYIVDELRSAIELLADVWSEDDSGDNGSLAEEMGEFTAWIER